MTEGGTPIRLALIGTGAISQIVHTPIFAERYDVDLVALADSDAPKAETIASRLGVPDVIAPDEALVREDLDAVAICTPNGSHEEMAIRALEAGKHVFVERPVALTSEGAARVVAAAKAGGRALVVGLPHRFRPEVAALRSWPAASSATSTPCGVPG